jgi:hypothetical protein
MLPDAICRECFQLCAKPHMYCTNDGICRSTADVQLVSYVGDCNLSLLLNQSINSFNTVCHLLSGQTAQAIFMNDTCPAILEPFHPFVHLPLHNTIFSVLYWHFFVNLEGFYPLWPQKLNDSMLLNSVAIQKWSWDVNIMTARASVNIMTTPWHAYTCLST